MSKLLGALSNIPQPGIERLRGVTQSQATVAQAGVDPSYASKSQLLGTVGKLAQYGADMYMQADAKSQAKADERSNEILTKLTPEQLKEARQNGTLLYQDDKYAMKLLKEKTGRNAAFQLDDEISQKVQRGEFKTRQELDEFRHKRLTDGRQEYANQFGFNAEDEDFQRGFSSNITERNIHIYGAHDTFLSERAKKGALLNSTVELKGALSDPDVLRSPQGPAFFTNYITKGLTDGTIASDGDAEALISRSLNDIVQQPGGSTMLQGLADKKITLHGKEATFKEVLGDEQFNSMVVKSQHAEFMNNSQAFEKFNLGLASAVNQSDTTAGWNMLNEQEAMLNAVQPGNLMTPERQQLVSARAQMAERFKVEAAATAKATDKARQAYNKNAVLDAAFDKRMAGEYVSTDYKDMPSNENTGEFKPSDATNYAAKKLADIEQMDLTDEQKDQKKLQYLRADAENGPFRTQFGTMITDAQGEWNAAVVNGEMPEKTPAMDSLRRIRNEDPGLFASLYPQQAGMFARMDLMDKMGIKPQILIDSERNKQRMTKDQQIEADKAWTATLNSSAAEEIARMPADLRDSARAVFDAFSYATGNNDGAMEQVTKFLKESTTTMDSDDLDGHTYGVLPRSALQVTSDPASWKQGKDILDATVKAHIAQNPWITNRQLSVTAVGKTIRVMDTTGTINLTYDTDLLKRMYKDNQDKLNQAAQAKAQATADEALANANKRAPIAAVNQVSAEIKSGKRKGLAQRAQEFRESRGIK